MLYNLLAPFADEFLFFNLFRYLTFRTGCAIMTALVICFVIAPSMIRWLKKKQKEEEQNRPGITVFHFKENGTNYNKIVKWNSAIQTDNGLLKNLLFRERAICGSSAVVLPSGKYVILKSDSHFNALHRTKAILAMAD